VVKLATSVLYGEPDETEDYTIETRESQRTRKSNPRVPAGDDV
jgi:hypothetical protein